MAWFELGQPQVVWRSAIVGVNHMGLVTHGKPSLYFSIHSPPHDSCFNKHRLSFPFSSPHSGHGWRRKKQTHTQAKKHTRKRKNKHSWRKALLKKTKGLLTAEGIRRHTKEQAGILLTRHLLFWNGTLNKHPHSRTRVLRPCGRAPESQRLPLQPGVQLRPGRTPNHHSDARSLWKMLIVMRPPMPMLKCTAKQQMKPKLESIYHIDIYIYIVHI